MESYENHLLTCDTDDYPLSGWVIERSDGNTFDSEDEEYAEEMQAEITNDILKERY